jgi:hypothetical protein
MQFIVTTLSWVLFMYPRSVPRYGLPPFYASPGALSPRLGTAAGAALKHIRPSRRIRHARHLSLDTLRSLRLHPSTCTTLGGHRRAALVVLCVLRLSSSRPRRLRCAHRGPLVPHVPATHSLPVRLPMPRRIMTGDLSPTRAHCMSAPPDAVHGLGVTDIA